MPSLGADMDTITQFPDQRRGCFAAATSTASVAARNRSNGVIALAENASSAGSVFKRADWQKAFDEDVE